MTDGARDTSSNMAHKKLLQAVLQNRLFASPPLSWQSSKRLLPNHTTGPETTSSFGKWQIGERERNTSSQSYYPVNCESKVHLKFMNLQVGTLCPVTQFDVSWAMELALLLGKMKELLWLVSHELGSKPNYCPPDPLLLPSKCYFMRPLQTRLEPSSDFYLNSSQ